VEAVFEAFVLGVPPGMKGVDPGMAVDGAQARQPGRELPDLIIAVAAPHGLVRHHQLISPGGLPPGQQDHGFGFVAGINRPEKGHGPEEKGRGQGRGGEQDFGLLGLQPGDARGRNHGLKKRGALHQEQAIPGEEVIDGVIGRGEIPVFQVNRQHMVLGLARFYRKNPNPPKSPFAKGGL